MAVDEKQLDFVSNALNLVKKKDKRSFRKILKCLKVIFVPSVRGHLNGTYEKYRVWITEGGILERNTTPFIASLIIHEAHHVSQYLSGHRYKLPHSEISSLREQMKFLKMINDDFSLNWLEKELQRKWWKDVVGNTKSTTKLDSYLEILKNLNK